MPLQGLRYLLYLAILTSAFAYLLFNKGIRLIGASGSAINQLLFPIVAVILSYFVLGEELNLWEALGISMIGAGILIAQFGVRRKTVPSQRS